MVVKMITWPLSSKKIEVKLVIKRLEGLGYVNDELTAEVKWKGLKKKMLGFGSLRGVKKDQTSVGVFDDGIGAFCWDQEFGNFCSFSGFKDCGEVVVTVVNVSQHSFLLKFFFRSLVLSYDHADVYSLCYCVKCLVSI